MATLKLTYNDEVRRVSLEKRESKRFSFAELRHQAVSLFPDLVEVDFVFSYTDDEGDRVNVSSDVEVFEALRILKEQERGYLKFHITSSVSGSVCENQSEHRGITCDQCGMSPIIGSRYKCTVRYDFDLCEGCEAKVEQPYPMLKYYQPNEGPAGSEVDVLASFFTGPHGRGGPHGMRRGGRGGCGRGGGGRGCGKRHGPHGPHGRGGGCGAAKDDWRHRFRHEQRAEKMSAVLAEVTERSQLDQADRDILDAVMQMSNESSQSTVGEASTASAPAAMPSAAAVPASSWRDVVAVAATATPVEESKEESVKESTSVAPSPEKPSKKEPAKLMARFVKDVTFPDGAKIPAGTPFCKTWTVRNDGSQDWPAGTTLTSAGGDDLTGDLDGEQLKLPVPAVEAGEEEDISVPLVAPQATGRHVGYFRLAQPGGALFGQRLWADIRVTENEGSQSAWQVVDSDSVTPSLQMAVPEQDDVQQAVEEQEDEYAGETFEPYESQHPSPSAAAVPNAPPFPPSFEVEEPNPADVWAAELSILVAMGFDNMDVLIPLLVEHVGSPAGPDGHPQPAGIQAVIASLLNY